MIAKNKEIIVGLSGGIDSSTALFLLKKQGWQPTGVFLKMSDLNNKGERIAKKVCQKLNCDFMVLDARKEFQKAVIDYFLKESRKGRTPNPCVVCNRFLKFEKLFAIARKRGIKHVASGHYARLKLDARSQKQRLLEAKCTLKDQTYYLSFLSQKQLKNLIFPLGDYSYAEVKKIAEKIGIKSLLKQKSSQDICFLTPGALNDFLHKKVGQKPGRTIDEQGRVLGAHQGIHFFTIGQRKGIGLGGGPAFAGTSASVKASADKSAGNPWFVKELDRKKNLVVVTQNKKEISQKEILLKPFNFISGEILKKKIRVRAKIRYQHQGGLATLFPVDKNGYLKIIFDKPQIAVTPGQFCVFYNRKICLGSGVIN